MQGLNKGYVLCRFPFFPLSVVPLAENPPPSLDWKLAAILLLGDLTCHAPPRRLFEDILAGLLDHGIGNQEIHWKIDLG